MTILIFGKDGQLGRAFQKRLRDDKNVIFLGRNECDISNEKSLAKYFSLHKPEVLINTAAFTAVDLAESSEAIAYAVNSQAPEFMARYCAEHGKQFIHFSTDYVFDGIKKEPYIETDPCNPLNIYGKSKLSGEQKIKEYFLEDPQRLIMDQSMGCFTILRSTWIYGDGANFIRSIIRLAKERETLNVVSDQYGVPVCADWLANLTIEVINSQIKNPGIYHAVPSGKTSWYGIAQYILECCNDFKIKIKLQVENLHPIPAKEYPSPTIRPMNSVLSSELLSSTYPASRKFLNEDWKIGVRKYIQSLRNAEEI